ncbi:MAG: 3-dehydroquinate synthase [Planctomycetes bacterium]|nr:3-dehydroquinate synthase [Planctomycetota bacterium]
MTRRHDLAVDLGPRSYPVSLTVGDGPALLAERVAALAPSRVLLVADATVADLHGAPVRRALGDPPVVTVPPGEASKGVARLEALWLALRDAGLDRDGLVVAFGGGVVGDLAGFAAATWLRGVRVVHAPTTLLATVDSAVGGKTGIDLGGKNLVGAFHQPSAVVADLAWLATLPAREVRSGLGEAWKTAVLAGDPLLADLERAAPRARAADPDALLPLVAACVAHKAAVVGRDEREAGERASLNLGHTLGHALEALAPPLGRDLPHGEAVAIGVAFACRVARRTGWLDDATCARLLAAGEALGLPLAPPWPVTLDDLRPLLALDKKARAGRPRWVLPRGPGAWGLAEVPDEVVDAALSSGS